MIQCCCSMVLFEYVLQMGYSESRRVLAFIHSIANAIGQKIAMPLRVDMSLSANETLDLDLHHQLKSLFVKKSLREKIRVLVRNPRFSPDPPAVFLNHHKDISSL